MGEPHGSNVFYRLVKSNPPTRQDFLSYEELGISLAQIDPESVRLSRGISVFRTEAQARRVARRRSFRGPFFIAELRIPANTGVRIERTTRSAGHYTLWADPDMIALWVVRVLPA